VGSKAGFASSIPSSQFEELDVRRHDILHEHLKVAPRKPEHQLELDTKQWCVINVISFNAFKSKIMSKLPPTAPGQLTVIFFPLVALHHSSCCKLPTGGSSGYCLHRSGNHPQLQRVHYGGNESINCNSNGATAARRNRRGNGDGGDRSIAIATAMGKEDWGTGQEQLGQLQ
jgi:hypothetical protein